jgi:hypothetical protein
LLLLFVLVLDADFSFAGSIGSPQQTNWQGSHSHPPPHGFSTITTSPHSLHSYMSPFSPFCFDKKNTSQKNADHPQKTIIKTT